MVHHIGYLSTRFCRRFFTRIKNYAGHSSNKFFSTFKEIYSPDKNYPIEFEKRGLPVSLTPQYYIPKHERFNNNLYNIHFKFGEERMARLERSDPTRELNFNPIHWRKHRSPFRKWVHVYNTLSSSVFQRLLFPELFLSVLVSTAVTYYNHFILPMTGGVATYVDMEGYAAATTAIELLAAYCLTSNYRRYEQCRLYWAETLSSSRCLAMNAMMWMRCKSQQKRIFKLLKAYPVCFNFHVNHKGGHYDLHVTDENSDSIKDRIQAEFQAELLDIYADEINGGDHDDDFRRLCAVKYKGGNASLEALTLMRETVAASIGSVDGMFIREMDRQIQRLNASLGSSERLLLTPLPIMFTRHTSRVLLVWCCVLPFAMYPSMGPYLTLPASFLTTYAVLGIEDVAAQIEVRPVLLSICTITSLA